MARIAEIHKKFKEDAPYLVGVPSYDVSIFTKEFTYKLRGQLGNPNNDILSITVSKDLTNPVGDWQIRFVPTDINGENWFDRIDIFSYIEIKLKGGGDVKEKMVMRGIVDNIEKEEEYSSTVPSRTITVSGRDFGALLTDIQVYWVPGIDPKRYLLKMLNWAADGTPFHLLTAQETFNIFFTYWKDMVSITVGETRVSLIDKVDTRAESWIKNGKTTNIHLISYQGPQGTPWWNLFSEYQDKPFHEIFIYDDDDFCRLIMRPSRLLDTTGNYNKRVSELIQDDIMYPLHPYFEVIDSEKIGFTIAKSGSSIYSYYITIPKVQMLSKESIQSIGLLKAGGNPKECKNPYFAVDDNLPSCINRYGFRPLEAGIMFMNTDQGEIGNDPPENTYEVKQVREYNKVKSDNLNLTMVAWFLANPLFRSGNMVIRGTNVPIIGTYVLDKGEGMEYYVEGVTHEFINFESYKTTLRLTRGQPPSAEGGLRSKYPNLPIFPD